MSISAMDQERAKEFSLKQNLDLQGSEMLM